MVKFSGVYVRLVGTWSFTVMLREAVLEPPVLLAQTVYAVVLHS